MLALPLRVLLNEAIAVNSTAFEDVDVGTGKRQFVGWLERAKLEN